MTTLYTVHRSRSDRAAALSTTNRERAFEYARGQEGYVVRVHEGPYREQTAIYVVERGRTLHAV